MQLNTIEGRKKYSANWQRGRLETGREGKGEIEKEGDRERENKLTQGSP